MTAGDTRPLSSGHQSNSHTGIGRLVVRIARHPLTPAVHRSFSVEIGKILYELARATRLVPAPQPQFWEMYIHTTVQPCSHQTYAFDRRSSLLDSTLSSSAYLPIYRSVPTQMIDDCGAWRGQRGDWWWWWRGQGRWQIMLFECISDSLIDCFNPRLTQGRGGAFNAPFPANSPARVLHYQTENPCTYV